MPVSNAFNLDAYIDLTSIPTQEDGGRLKDEIRTTLMYVASKPAGRKLIEEAAHRGGQAYHTIPTYMDAMSA